MPEPEVYRSEHEVAEMVRRFESCEFRNHEFTHARHVATAAWYCLHFGDDRAARKMRDALKVFAAHHGSTGYHETITDFWLRAVAAHVRELRRTHSPVDVVNRIVADLSDKNLVFRHYSREKIASPEAKAACTEPDLIPLPF